MTVLGQIDARQGQHDSASMAFRRGRDIIAELARRSPDNAMLRRDLAWFDGRIGGDK